MDWQGAIEKNRAALVGVMASLCAMIGLAATFDLTRLTDPDTWREVDGRPIEIRRAMRIDILRLLRAAESALRRLIVAQLALTKTTLPPCGGDARRAEGGYAVKMPVPKKKPRFAARRTPDYWTNYIRPFPLYDAVRHYGMKRRRKPAKHPPRILFPFNPDFVFRPVEPAEPPHPCDLLDARPLFKRLAGLYGGLTDLPRQAQRLARAEARRARRMDTPPPPIRIGRPPGFAKRKTHEAYLILDDCHWIARDARPPP